MLKQYLYKLYDGSLARVVSELVKCNILDIGVVKKCDGSMIRSKIEEFCSNQ